MKYWRRNQQQQQHQQEEKKKKNQTSPSSSFSLSSVLPFSWFAKLTASKPKRSAAVAVRRGGEVFTPPPSPRRPLDPSQPRSDSAHIPFSPAALDRFPPPVHDAAPRRLSLGDDDSGRLPRIAPASVYRRSVRHHSVGDLELTLGNIIPFSRRATERWAESDSRSDASGCDLGLGRRPPRRRRRRRSARTSVVGNSLDHRVDSEGRDGLPRRSFSGKIRHRAKVKVRSPRPTAVARAEVERMRAVTRRRGRVEGEEGGRRKGLERFAVVKCSCDPQRDFRESMVEMIWQKGIGRPDELESLLACYLSLNSDEHHDVIVKVFRQVWFELNQERLAPECNRRR
ncbi:hypothetical protein Cni_G23441 [Canna indica]|uniref:Transcription repressor n=1 Tax=Canna indica TaxID=4628 RepID=A0AAQ3KUF9_9LILI|nr:hypothetical protein Cni_G23441 [Canna indica]